MLFILAGVRDTGAHQSILKEHTPYVLSDIPNVAKSHTTGEDSGQTLYV